jgi:hypothetical protein
MVTLLLKRSEYLVSFSILFIKQKLLAAITYTVMGRKLQDGYFRIKKETTKQCADRAIAREIEAVTHSLGVLVFQPGHILLL